MDNENKEMTGESKPSGLPPAPDFAKILAEIKLPERRDDKKTGMSASVESVETYQKSATHDYVSAVVVPPTKEQVAEKDASVSSVQALHTLKHDLQHVVKESKMSLVRAASLEQDRRIRNEEHEVQEFERKTSTLSSTLFTVAILFFLGSSALFGVYIIMQQKMGVAPIAEQKALIFSEKTVSLPLQNITTGQLRTKLEEIRNGISGKLGSVIQVVPIKEYTDSEGETQQVATSFIEYTQKLNIVLPPDLSRAVGPEMYFGIHITDENAPFFVVPIISYEHAFSGMLAWEHTIGLDLMPLFSGVPGSIVVDGIPRKRAFSDILIKNYDARALKDDSGVTQLYYVFPSINLLVIAENINTFPEILTRLRADKKI